MPLSIYGISERTFQRRLIVDINIRNEAPEDYREVEELTKKAFWNVNVPGCDEHYIAHILREHADFISELDFILTLNGKIIANIMYTKSRLSDETGAEKEIVTFGPFSVLPEYQRMGYGKKLLEYSLKKAADMGFEAAVIFGNPENYVMAGFKSCKKYNVAISGGIYPVALLVKELKEGALAGKRFIYKESPAYEYDREKAEEFDKTFEQMPKEYRPSQELFYIYSGSAVQK